MTKQIQIQRNAALSSGRHALAITVARRGITFVLALLSYPAVAAAGMPSVTLTDLAQMRLNAISFFLVAFLLSSWGVQNLWNFVQHDFPRWPVLSYRKALAVVFLWGMLFLLVLTMISGARELMTPGAWEKRGLTYKLAGTPDKSAKSSSVAHDALIEARRTHLEELRTALLLYASKHDGRFPDDENGQEVAAELWQVPEKMGMQYVYIAGLTTEGPNAFLACEPDVFEDGRFALLTSGKIERLAPKNAPVAQSREQSK